MPYQEFLVGFLYDVEQVISGEYGEKQILVMHPAYIGLKPQSLDKFRVGKLYELQLRPLGRFALEHNKIQGRFRPDRTRNHTFASKMKRDTPKARDKKHWSPMIRTVSFRSACWSSSAPFVLANKLQKPQKLSPPPPPPKGAYDWRFVICRRLWRGGAGTS
jgi:hypothetical protein